MLLFELVPELCLIAVVVGVLAVLIGSPSGARRDSGPSAAADDSHPPLTEVSDAIYDLTVLEDGDLLFSSFRSSLARLSPEGAVRWDRSRSEANQTVRMIASPIGGAVAVDREGGVHLLSSIETPTASVLLGRHNVQVAAATISPDGRFAATASVDGDVRLWDLTARTLLHGWSGEPEFSNGGLPALGFSPDGTRLARTLGAGIRIHRVPTGEVVSDLRRRTSDSPPCSLAFSPDLHWLVEGDFFGRVALWDLEHQVVAWTETQPGSAVLAFEFAPEGNTLLAGFLNGELRAYDCESGEVQTSVLANPRGVKIVRQLPDRRSFLTAGYDGRIRRWDFATLSSLGTLR